MDAKEVIKNLSDADVEIIMSQLGSKAPKPVRGGLAFETICHNDSGEGHHKLYYYSEKKIFYCYSNCGNIGNIFSLVMQVNDCEFKEAYTYVCEILSINPTYSTRDVEGFGEKIDNSFINKFNKNTEKRKYEKLEEKKNIMDKFYKLYHKSWLDDFITKESMDKFGIRFDVENNAIVIPHFDIDNRLIGIRVRNMNQELIDMGMKYIPLTYEKVLYSYPTAMNLFGINITKEAIRKYKKVVIGEAEKFVLQHYSYYGEDSIAVALNGSSFHDYQIELLKELGVEEIVFALDKEYSTIEEAIELENKMIEKYVSKVRNEFTVSVIWGGELLNLKESPTDRGKEIYEQLFENRFFY